MIVEKASNAVTQGGAGVAVISGGYRGVELVLGLTPGQWSVIGVIGGLAIGILGYLTSLYFNLRKK